MTTVIEEQADGAGKRAMTMSELRKFDGQLFIQNKSPHKVTCYEQRGKEIVGFELDPAGQPESIAFLPKEALDVRGLQRLWMKKEVAISTDPDMEEQIMLMNAQSVGVSQQRMDEIMGKTTEAANSRDQHEKLCLACGFRNDKGVVERGRVLQSAQEVKRGEKPLCSEHLSESHRFVPRLVSEKGEEHWEFDAVVLNDPRAGRS